MRKKTMMLFFALAVSSVSAWAQTTTASCVVVEETNGNKTEFLLATEPRITYDGDVVTLECTEDNLVLDAAEVKKVYLSQTNLSGATAIQQVEATKSVLFDLTDGNLSVNGLETGSPVALYTADGRQIYAGTANAAGSLSLPLGSFQGGMIIVKTAKQTFKIIKK